MSDFCFRYLLKRLSLRESFEKEVKLTTIFAAYIINKYHISMYAPSHNGGNKKPIFYASCVFYDFVYSTNISG